MATTGGTQSRLDSVEWSNQNSGSRHYPEGQSMTSIPPPLDSAGGSSNAASPTRRPTSDEWPIGAMIGDLRAGYARGVEAGWDRQSVMAELFSQVQVPRRIGRFEITEPKPIGSGGMGKVFEGYDARLHRRVAIKLLECSCGLGEERFAREARALARLSHPNIVQVHEVGQHEEAMFIAMEYVEGQTLREWAAEGRSWAEVLRTYIEAGSGLAAAHAAGMVHRDFKPDNAMVGVDGRVRVLDFGLVRSTPTSAEGDVTSRGGASERVEGRGRAVESLTATGSVLGTVPYMAPEQHQGREVTPASDQYAFCVSVYEALYGTRPFGGETRFAVYDAIVQRSWQRPTREIRVPRRSIAAIRRGLAVEPEHRWPSMDALLAELQAAFRIKRLRLLGAGALLGALPAVGALWVGAEGEDAPCASFEERAGGVLPSVWDSERKTAIAEAFDSSGVPFAESSWSAVEAGIGRWVQRLARQRLDVCEAHHLRHEQSAEAMDLRMACLDRQQAELQAMVEVLASAEAEVVLRAPEAILELPRVEDCVDVERLRERVSGPDELVAAEVHEARESIDRARAMLWAGRYREGLAVARQALGRAERARYRPAASEARLVLGQLEIGAGAIAEGVVTLERSARDALRDRYDEVAAEAWARLARYASGMHALEAGRRWLLDAEVLYERLGRGDEDEVVIGLKWSEANLARQQGELSDAEHGLDIVVEAHRRRLAGDEGDPRAVLMLALAIDDLANVVHERGRYEEAVALHAEGSLSIVPCWVSTTRGREGASTVWRQPCETRDDRRMPYDTSTVRWWPWVLSPPSTPDAPIVPSPGCTTIRDAWTRPPSIPGEPSRSSRPCCRRMIPSKPECGTPWGCWLMVEASSRSRSRPTGKRCRSWSGSMDRGTPSSDRRAPTSARAWWLSAASRRPCRCSTWRTACSCAIGGTTIRIDSTLSRGEGSRCWGLVVRSLRRRPWVMPESCVRPPRPPSAERSRWGSHLPWLVAIAIKRANWRRRLVGCSRTRRAELG